MKSKVEPSEALVNFTNLATFSSKNLNCIVVKHRVCQEALKYLAKLANVPSENFPTDLKNEQQCKCFKNDNFTSNSSLKKSDQVVNKSLTLKTIEQYKLDSKIQTLQSQKLNQLINPKDKTKNCEYSNLKPNEVFTKASSSSTTSTTQAKNMMQLSNHPNATISSTTVCPSLTKETVIEQQSSMTVVKSLPSSQIESLECETEAKKQIFELIQLINRFNNAGKIK